MQLKCQFLGSDNWIPKAITRLASFPRYMSTNHQALQMNAITPPYRIALLGTTHLALPISMHCGSTSEDPRHCMRRVRSFEQIYCPSIHRLSYHFVEDCEKGVRGELSSLASASMLRLLMKENIVTSVASGAWLLWCNRGIRILRVSY